MTIVTIATSITSGTTTASSNIRKKPTMTMMSSLFGMVWLMILFCLLRIGSKPSFFIQGKIFQEDDGTVPEEDVMTTFDWDVTPCTKFPFTAGNNFTKCGILEFCTTENGGYGYRQKVEPVNNKCYSPGPVIRVQPGSKYLLTLHNTLDDDTVTNIHTHGFHISSDGNSDNTFREALSDECIHYVWDVKSNTMGGTHWYHPHRVNNVFRQLSKGAFGMFIVEDDYSKLLPSSSNDTSTTSLVSFLKNEKLLLASRIFSIRRLGRWSTNGNRKGARINMVQNEWTRLRIGISSPRGYSDQIKFRNPKVCSETYVIAYDGIYVLEIPGSSLPRTVGGSGRVDVAVRCTGAVGETAVLAFGRDIIGQITIVSNTSSTVAVPPNPYSPTDGTSKWKPVRPNYVRDLMVDGMSYDASLKIELSDSMAINGKEFDDVNNSIATYEVGNVVSWNIVGSDFHPAHFHVHHMQLVSKCGDMEIGAFYDTIEGDDGDECQVLFNIQDYDGKTLFHCHNSIHSDFDMMVTVNITAGNGTTSTVQRTNPDVDDKTCYF